MRRSRFHGLPAIWTQLVETWYTPLEEVAKFFDGEEKDTVDLTNASVKQVEVEEGVRGGGGAAAAVGETGDKYAATGISVEVRAS